MSEQSESRALAEALGEHRLGADTAQQYDTAGQCSCGRTFYERGGDPAAYLLANRRLIAAHDAHRTDALLASPQFARLIAEAEARGAGRVREAVERLARSWAAVPPYTASDYDQGRVDQREMCGEELAEVILRLSALGDGGEGQG